MRIALFITCLTDNFFPRTGVAVVKVLEHLGHEVEFPADQTCCGQPLHNNGFSDEARLIARRFVEVFSGFEAIVTPSASCAAMVREHYPRILGLDSASTDPARGVIDSTFEFAEFLVQKAGVNLGEMGVNWSGAATYHPPCHLRDLHRPADDTAALIAQIPDLSHTALEHAEQCCGFGGTFASKYPQISGSMVRDKVQAIENTKADTLICSEAGCAMNIAGACRRQSVPVRVVSLAEVIAEGLGLMDREPA